MNTTDVAALCTLEAISDHGVLAVEAVPLDGDIESLLLCRHGDEVRAYLNICPHAGRRLDWAPGKFLLKDGQLICAAHGASFRTDDGLCVAGPCRGQSLKAVPLREHAGRFWLA